MSGNLKLYSIMFSYVHPGSKTFIEQCNHFEVVSIRAALCILYNFIYGVKIWTVLSCYSSLDPAKKRFISKIYETHLYHVSCKKVCIRL
jgi:hypothetical protein